MTAKKKPQKPLDSSHILMSTGKQSWWAGAWPAEKLRQPRVVVFHFAMNSAVRPTASDESVAYGYTSQKKFHDREPEAVLKVMEAQDPTFFDSYPRKKGTKLTRAFKKAAIGEAARAFYRHGMAAYGKPELRKKPVPPPPVKPPLAHAVRHSAPRPGSRRP